MNMYKDGELKALGDVETILRNIGAPSLKEVLSDRFDVTYAKGCDIISPEKDGFEQAIAAAKECDGGCYGFRRELWLG